VKHSLLDVIARKISAISNRDFNGWIVCLLNLPQSPMLDAM
jgi:hypothetical protein